MKQGVLPFQYEQEKRSTGMTALVRPDYLLGVATRIRLEVIDRAPRRVAMVWSGLDGQPDSQLADTAEPSRGRVGGRSRYPGEGRGVLQGGSRGRDLGNGSQRAQGVGRAVACGASSESAVFRYLEMFHDASEEARREAHRAFIPSPNEALRGLHQVNVDLLSFVQSR